MKNTGKIGFIVLTLTVIIVSVLFTKDIIDNTETYSKVKAEYAQTLNFQDRLLNSKSWLLPDSEYIPKKIVSEDQMSKAKEAYDKSITKATALFAILIGYIIVVYALFAQSLKGVFSHLEIRKKVITTSYVVSSFCLLGVGISTPIMEFEAYNENMNVEVDLSPVRESIYDAVYIESWPIMKETTKDGVESILFDGDRTFKGKTYYIYKQKSILGVVKALLKDNNYFVALCLGLFSIGIPIFKLLFSLLMVWSSKIRESQFFRTLVYYLGKWSMADVFVVSIFLAYLSLSNMSFDVDTESNALMGIYFFAAYVIISMISSHFVSWVVGETKYKSIMSYFFFKAFVREDKK